MPFSFAHVITFQSVVFFRCGEVVLLSCLHCARGNERFKFYVQIEFSNRNAFLNDFFYSACANCLVFNSFNCLKNTFDFYEVVMNVD